MTLFGSGLDNSNEPSGRAVHSSGGRSRTPLVPKCGDVGVSQEEQLATAGGCIVPDGLGDVCNGVLFVGPGGEEADLGFALGPDRAVQETDAGMAAARIGQNARARVISKRSR